MNPNDNYSIHLPIFRPPSQNSKLLLSVYSQFEKKKEKKNNSLKSNKLKTITITIVLTNLFLYQRKQNTILDKRVSNSSKVYIHNLDIVRVFSYSPQHFHPESTFASHLLNSSHRSRHVLVTFSFASPNLFVFLFSYCLTIIPQEHSTSLPATISHNLTRPRGSKPYPISRIPTSVSLWHHNLAFFDSVLQNRCLV